MASIEIKTNSKLFLKLEKILEKKIHKITKKLDEDVIYFADNSFIFCEFKIIFDEQTHIDLIILDDEFNPVGTLTLAP